MRICAYIVLLIPFLLHGQGDPVKSDSTRVEYIIIEGDSIPRTSIDLNEVLLLPSIKFKNRDERIKYLILQRKTIKVYPYAKLAAERLVELNARLNSLKRKSQKRKYSKIIQHYIEDEFSEELKKLTRTEGQILIKLVHRQTGKTTFELIKELRSGWRAFWFNNTASLFKISLKREFNPLSNEEDFLIEDILRRSFQNGRLQRQDPAFEIDYYDLTDKWLASTIKKTN